MTDVNQTTETSANTTAEATENKPEQSCNNTGACGWHKCRSWGNQHGGHGKHCCKKKAILGIALIALLSFFAGKGCSHHHDRHAHMGQMEQPNVTQSYNGQAQQMPLSMMLDGIGATPDQRAKAVNLLH